MHTSTASTGFDFGKVDFGKIIEKSQNILASGGLIDSFSTLTGIQRANQNLAKRARPDADTELTARIFFASHGMDVSHQLEALRAVCSPTSSSLSDFKRQRESDASSFLESQKQTLMTSTIEDSLRLVSAFSRDVPDDNLRDEWQATKRRVLDALSSCPLPIPSSSLGSNSSTSSSSSDGSFESNAASVTEASQKLSLALSSSMLPFSDRTFSNTSGEITFGQKTYAKAVAHNNRSYAEQSSNATNTQQTTSTSVSSLISLFSGAASYIEQTLAANTNTDTSSSASLTLAADSVELWELISSLAKDPIPRQPAKSSLSTSITTSTTVFSLSPLAEMTLASRAAGYLERSFHDHVRGVIIQDPGLLARAAGSSAAYSSLHPIHRSVHEAAAYLLSPVYQARFARDTTPTTAGVSNTQGNHSLGSIDGYGGTSTFPSTSSASSSTSSISAATSLGSASASSFNIPPFANSVWSLIYYVFRMGDIEAAAALLAVTSSSTRAISAPILTTAFETIISGSSSSSSSSTSTSNASIFTASTSEALSILANDLETELFTEEIATSDPYRVAIYHLVGRIQLSANVMRYRLNRYVFLNVEDLIWSHLHLCTFTPTSTSTAYVSGFSMPTRLSAPSTSTTATKWSLSALKKHIMRLVAQQQSQQRFFPTNASTEFENPDQDRLLSVRLLLLTQQFPEAIRVLLRIDNTVALHVAIALTFAGVLPVTGNITGNSYSSAINASLSAAASIPSTSSLSTSMNSLGENVLSSGTAVVALITRYARSTMAKESTVAFHYIFLLRRMLELDGSLSSLSTSLPTSAGASLANSILTSTSSTSFSDGTTNTSSSFMSSAMPMDEILLVELLTQSSDLETLIGTSKDPFASLTELDTRGIIPSYYPLTVVARVVARAADLLCARDGPSQRSLTLLALAGRSGRVVSYLSSKLAACAMKPASDPVKASLMLDVTRYVNAANTSLSTTGTMSNDAGTTSELQRSIHQLSTILSIAGFFSLLHAGKDRQEAALTVLAQTGFLPFSPQSIAASSLLGSSEVGNKTLSNDLASAIRSEATSPENIAARRQRKAESNGDVLSLLGSVALASVTAAYNLYADAQNETVREFWRLQARTLLDCVINEWADCITVNNRMQILRIESMIPF